MKRKRRLRSLALRRDLQMAMTALSEKTGRDRFEPGVFQIEHVCVTIPDLNPAFDGYRIASIADIHLGQWLSTKRLDGVIGMINKQHPDLIAIIGDLFSYEVDRYSTETIASFTKLNPKDASVAVLGNHDHWVGEAAVREILQQSNIIDLSNDVYTLHRRGAALHFAGVDSVSLHKHRLDVVLSKLPSSGPAILLAHEPDFADVSATTGRFSLQISGHSHGGQFIIPYIGTLVKAPHAKKYPLGRYQVGDMVQYTSRGLGTNVFWIRVNCPPEITVFTLTCADGAQIKNKTKPFLRNVSRTLVIWVGEAVGLLLLAHFIPGLTINSFAAAIAFVVVLGIVNAILWPILTRCTLRFLTYTFGIGALLLNALMVWLTSILVPGAGVEGLGRSF